MTAAKLKTRISTKGQVILPKAIRDRKHWRSGTELTVEETPDGVLLRPERVSPVTRIEDVFGCLKYEGPPMTIEDMDRAVLEEAKRQYLASFDAGD